jgi:DNA-binding transcriptional regulator/RsmH inhibitor MraZ
VIAGALDKIEVWDRKEWDAVLDPATIDKKTVAQKLTEYGI